ncbi:MAG: SUMF1/EgtB/PvdO family nonheme iron enzyme [Verrucomicrobiae bacterium]|nr:SUMF1/EgtB/PvdO family nonheme iron enzyme [Verrucomicrobiae bacterium]
MDREPFVNSLSMKFVPVPDTQVLFCIWETRVQDFEVFVRETGYNAIGGMVSLKDGKMGLHNDSWSSPGFEQTGRHPVCGVSWEDAQAFCRWLSDKEGRRYRLPTDDEWSRAVGLPSEVDGTPRSRSGGVRNVYPWGKSFPPPPGSGNYAGNETPGLGQPQDHNRIPDYTDGHAQTAAVGTYSANAFGLFDLGGNLWEWTEDWYDESRKFRVLRGGSWFNGAPAGLLSSFRGQDTPQRRNDRIGFRVVCAGSPR